MDGFLWQTPVVAIVHVQWSHDTRGEIASYVACSMCLGTGSIEMRPAKLGRSSGWSTCPTCYGTGVKDMLYETVIRHGSD